MTTSFPQRRGSALVIVLGMLSVMLLMGIAFSVTMRTERSGASNMRHAAMARHILDSAIARTMSDLDATLLDDGDLPVPTNLVVAVSGDPDATVTVNPLSHEAARHLPGDQLAAALFARAQWLPIYGDIRISTYSSADPTSEDGPVGRYAYVVLNGTGLLDPNVVAVSNRSLGLSPYEIDIAGGGNNGRVLDMPKARAASLFTSERNRQGHFVSMRDFLRPAVTNLLGYPAFTITGQRYAFPTNSFGIGGLALDDLAPPIGAEQITLTGTTERRYVPIRRPKFPLREYADSNANSTDEETVPLHPADIVSDADLRNRFVEAMTNSFLATYQHQNNSDLGALPRNFENVHQSGKRIPFPLLAARNLLDMMDDDASPGGYSGGHSLSSAGEQGGSNDDEYLAKFGHSGWAWDRLPCVEPVPLLDNLVILGGYDPSLNASGSGSQTNCLAWKLEKEQVPGPPDANGNSTMVDGNITSIVCTVSLSVLSSAVYPAWNVPAFATGTYTYDWRIMGYHSDNTTVDNKYKRFVDALDAELGTMGSHDVKREITLKRKADGTVDGNKRFDSDVAKLPSIQFSIDVGSVDTNGFDIAEYIPDKFGLVLHAIGFIGCGNESKFDDDLVQIVPCLERSLSAIDLNQNPDSVLDLYLTIDREEDSKEHVGDDTRVLGAAYALDPRFAYMKFSWSWTPGLSELDQGGGDPGVEMRKALIRDKISDLDVLQDDNNPLTDLYLKTPRRKFGGKELFEILADDLQCVIGGASDVMHSAPADDFFSPSTSQANAAARNGALSVHFDPDEPDDSPWAFTRVGQLGFVPIGTHKTIALLDGFDNARESQPHASARQRVLDYFTMQPPRRGSSFSSNDPFRTGLFGSRLNLNPPRAQVVTNITGNGSTRQRVADGDYNLAPLTAALNGCPLREWENSAQYTVSWDTAADLASVFADTLDRHDSEVENENGVGSWKSAQWRNCDDARGLTHSLSVLGRATYDSNDEDRESFDTILHAAFPQSCDFDREGVVRNTAGMLTTRQQLFTVLLKADSFTPKFGFSDAEHGTSLASVQAIAHIWRDPEPLRDADGRLVTDNRGNPIHPWVLLDLYQF